MDHGIGYQSPAKKQKRRQKQFVPGDNCQVCEPIGGAPDQGPADQVAADYQKLILPALRYIEGAPKLFQAPGSKESRHQDKDGRKIDWAVNVESQECIGREIPAFDKSDQRDKVGLCIAPVKYLLI